MDLDLTRIFVKVIQTGSFSKAATVLRMPNSTVSKAVAKLEKKTGTQLILRTTRSLTLTQSGRAYYEACIGPIARLEDAEKSLYMQDSVIAGTLKVTAPEDLGFFVIAPAISHLSVQYEKLFFDIEFKNDIVDLVKEGFDIAVRIGPIRNSGLKIKKVGELYLIPVATPGYMKRSEPIRHPKELNRLTCLSLNYEATAKHWSLRTDKSASKIIIKPKIIANQMTSLLQMTLAGAGVSLLPSYVCSAQIKSGTLVRLLPEWRSHGIPVSIMTPLAPSSSARLKITVDHFYEGLKNAIEEVV
jgi:LysR family transcriptional regulator, regulator for bpeEF and oprC